MKVAVLGASGKTGRHLVARLCEEGFDVTAVGLSAERLAALDRRARRAVADLERPAAVKAALNGAERVVSLAHARFTRAVLAALPPGCERAVLTGSVRKFSKIPDSGAQAVRAGEAAFAASGRPGVMLHPSMIYGAPDDRNVGRILRLIRRWPKGLPLSVPLPDGGRHLVQPVFIDDMVAAVFGALTRDEAPGPPIVVAGPEPITYAEMVRTCARALGRRAVVVPIPTAAAAGIARCAAALGVRLPFEAAELRRAGEDKRFDITDMRRRLGVTPRPFAEGLRLKLARGWG